MLSHGLQTCNTKRRSSCSTPGSLDANLSINFAQKAVKYTQETILSSSSSLESKQRSLRSSSRELPYQAFGRRSSKVHFLDESDLSIQVVARNVAKYTKETTHMPVLSPGVETKRRSSGSRILETKLRLRSRSRSTPHEDGQRHSSRKAVRFTGESKLSIMLDQDSQEAVKYTQETIRNFSSSLKKMHCSSRSTSHEAGLLPYRHRSSRTMNVMDKSEISILAKALDVAKYTQETTQMSSPDVETKLRSSRSTSRETGQHRSSLKQRSPRSTSRQAESAEILYQRRGRSGRVHFADESNLPIMTQDVTKYVRETTDMSSPGPDLETKQRSSRSTSLEAGHRRSSRKAVHFTRESDLSIMLALEVVKLSQESTFSKPEPPPQRFLAKIWESIFKTVNPAKKQTALSSGFPVRRTASQP